MDKESRLLIKLLRHQLVDIGLIPNAEGYVPLFNLLSRYELLKSLTIDNIKEIVETSDKDRFSIKEVDGVWMIRANQGHSKKVGDKIESNKAMTIIKEPISGVFHGTYKELYDVISRDGLKPMRRKHIHIAKSLEAKSGKRKDCSMLVYVDMDMAMKDGIIFYESQNGVILTEGLLLPKYLRFEII
jgi:RNA:NAD 2'-phosphotransferase (TPT1/KptA family)